MKLHQWCYNSNKCIAAAQVLFPLPTPSKVLLDYYAFMIILLFIVIITPLCSPLSLFHNTDAFPVTHLQTHNCQRSVSEPCLTNNTVETNIPQMRFHLRLWPCLMRWLNRFPVGGHKPKLPGGFASVPCSMDSGDRTTKSNVPSSIEATVRYFTLI